MAALRALRAVSASGPLAPARGSAPSTLAAAVASGGPAAVPRRHRTSAARARLMEKNKRPPSYSIALAKSRKRVPQAELTRNGHAIRTVNHPEFIERRLDEAAAIAQARGAADAVADFDAAAAAFPNPPPLVAATLLERSNIIMAEPPSWMVDFRMWKEKRQADKTTDFPDEFWENYGNIDADLKPSAIAARAKAAKSGSGAGAGAGASAGAGAGDFDMFVDPDAQAEDDALASSSETLKPAPRETEADKINDTRSLDRALASRLALLVKDASTGAWGLPAGTRREGERLVDAAFRHLHAALGMDVNVWYPGNAPMGHWLRVFTPEQQAATGCYGAKVFIYRAEILNGRPSLNSTEAGVPELAADTGVGAPLAELLNAHGYEDLKWLTRSEIASAELLEPTFGSYMHGVIGASPCELSGVTVPGQGAVLAGFNDGTETHEGDFTWQ